MKFGYDERNGNLVCANCGSVVGKNNTLTCEFCYKCGNPISIKAFEMRGEEYTNERIKLIYEIKKDVENGNDIKEILKDYIESIHKD